MKISEIKMSIMPYSDLTACSGAVRLAKTGPRQHFACFSPSVYIVLYITTKIDLFCKFTITGFRQIPLIIAKYENLIADF